MDNHTIGGFFMRHSKILILLAVLLLSVSLTASALTEGVLTELWNSGCNLLFHTDNVTVTGEASFALDGQHFKTAKLNYVQDGCNSFYGLTLLTPKADGTERETGWTIIADEKGNYYVMERYYPGTYKSGFDTPNDTLLRRSVRLDALTELGGMLMGPLESMMPEGTVTVSEADGAKKVHILLAEDQIPGMAVSALNLAAGYLSDRWFAFGRERTVVEDECFVFDNYVTVSQALTDGTVHWALKEADVEFTLDAQGRLAAAQGNVRAASTFWDGVIREVTVRFDLAFTDYGSSHVKPFDADEYGVEPARMYWEDDGEEVSHPLEDDVWDATMSRVSELLPTLGYPVDEEASFGGWYDVDHICVDVTNPDGTQYYCEFAADGSLVVLENLTAEWYLGDEADADSVDADTIAAGKEKILSFVAEHNPPLAESMGALSLESQITTEDGSQYLVFDDMEQYTSFFVVRVAPSLRIESFSGMAAE